ncbi:hypothetical protein ACHAWF_003590 [Thalassiosira exigua]
MLEDSTTSSPRQTLQIYSVNDDKTITLDVHPSYMIIDIKAMIQNQLGIPTYRQRLYDSGKPLENKNTLASYNIPSASARLHMYTIVPGTVRVGNN